MNLKFGKKEFLEQPKQNVIDVHSHECLVNKIVFLNNLKHNYLQSLFFLRKKIPCEMCFKIGMYSYENLYGLFIQKQSFSCPSFFGQTNERGTLATTLDV